MNKILEQLKELLPHLDKRKQMVQAMEECGELVQALAKELNDKPRKPEDLVDEIVDVTIMVFQMATYFTTKESFNKRADYKLDRIKKYVDSVKVKDHCGVCGGKFYKEDKVISFGDKVVHSFHKEDGKYIVEVWGEL